MSAPVTSWSDQPNFNPTLAYDDSATAYDASTVFYDNYDPAGYDPKPAGWTDAT